MNQSINQSRRAKEARGNPRARRRAPSRPRAFPPPPRGGRLSRNPDDAKPRRREHARIAASHRRRERARSTQMRCAAEIQSSSCPITHRIDRSIALVSGPSHLFHARASYSCSCSYVPCVHFLVDQTCRRRASSVAVCARRIRGRRRRDGRSRLSLSRALCFDVQCAVYVLQ